MGFKVPSNFNHSIILWFYDLGASDEAKVFISKASEKGIQFLDKILPFVFK